MHQQHVVGLERLAQRRPPGAAQLHHLEDRHVVLLAEPAVENRRAHQGRVAADSHLRHVLTQVIYGGDLSHPTVRQQPSPEQQEKGHSRREEDQAHPGELEHAERPVPGLLGDRADQQIRRGADQGAHPSELGGVGQGNQQLRRRQPAAVGEDGHQGDEDGHGRGVVHERRHHGDRAHDDHQRRVVVPAEPHHQTPDRRRRSRLLQTGAQHEHGGHGQGGRVAEAREPLLGGDQAEDQEHPQPDHGHQLQRILFRDEQDDGADQDRQHHDGFGGHVLGPVIRVSGSLP